MTRRGIVACGVYIPRLRLRRTAITDATAWLKSPGAARAQGERAFCNWDEDAITMAVEAARACLGSRDRGVNSFTLASTTMPFADRSNAGIVGAAIDLARSARCADATGSQRAATSALLAALDRNATHGTALIAASDRRLAKPGSPQELAYGHGAAAVLVGSDGVIAEMLGGASLHDDLVDHYRGSGAEFDYVLEERWVRDLGHMKLLPAVITSALESAGLGAASIAHTILPVPLRTAQAIARQLALPAESLAADLTKECGDIGVGHPLLRLARCLETARRGEHILLAGFGQGADAIVLRVTEAIEQMSERQAVERALARRIEETHYTRFLSHCGLVEMDFGMRAERDNRTAHSASYRRQRDIAAFVGGRCTRCDTVQFPRTHTCVNPECRAFETQVEHPLADTPGRVKTYTEDWLAYSARPPFVYGNVGLEGGGNVFIEFADTTAGELAVGRKVAFTFRIKDFDRQRRFHRYFWKATPVEE